MKNFNTIVASTILFGLISVGNAFASDGGVDGAVKQELANNVTLSIDNGVATLTGVVEDAYEKQTMETAASMLDGINEVRNHLSVSTAQPELVQRATTSDVTSG